MSTSGSDGSTVKVLGLVVPPGRNTHTPTERVGVAVLLTDIGNYGRDDYTNYPAGPPRGRRRTMYEKFLETADETVYAGREPV
jgi:hypothetical protein